MDSDHVVFFRRAPRAADNPEGLPPIAAGKNSWYRPGELLMRRDAAVQQRLRDAGLVPLSELDEVADHWRRHTAELLRTNLALAERLARGGHDLFVAQDAGVPDDLGGLDDLVRGRHAPVMRNRVLVGEGKYHGGPGGAPSPASPPLDDAALALLAAPVEGAGRPVTVVVLDTGRPDEPVPPGLLGADLSPDPVLAVRQADHDRDGLVGSQTGHGMFIQSLIRMRAPGAKVESGKVLVAAGDTDDATVTAALTSLLVQGNRPDIVNLSLGGFTEPGEPEPAMAGAVRALIHGGTAVVAAAGNYWGDPLLRDRTFYPARVDGVISVGATTADGGSLAPFTARGTHARVYAPGVGAVAAYRSGTLAFDPDDSDANRATPQHPAQDFHGWASWSGTSFAAPLVCAALARTLAAAPRTTTAAQLVESWLAGLPQRTWHGPRGQDVTGPFLADPPGPGSPGPVDR